MRVRACGGRGSAKARVRPRAFTADDVADLELDVGAAGDRAAGADDFDERRRFVGVVYRQLGDAKRGILLDEADDVARRGLDHDFLRDEVAAVAMVVEVGEVNIE